MKAFSTIVLGLALAVVVGCQRHDTAGGPGASRTQGGSASLLGKAEDDTFRLVVPDLGTNINQGETKTISIGIKRGKNFDQDVKLDFSGAPPGVKLEPASPDLKAGDKEVQVKMEAAKDAALGEHTITVNGTPAKGDKATATFKIDVKKAG